MASNRNELTPEEKRANEAEARRGFAETLKAMTDAVGGNKGMADIVNDAYRSNPVTGGGSQASKPVERGTGWQTPRPLASPPGINYVDALCDAQDAKDRAEKIAELQARIKTLKGE
jgi:hypothetical protein